MRSAHRGSCCVGVNFEQRRCDGQICVAISKSRSERLHSSLSESISARQRVQACEGSCGRTWTEMRLPLEAEHSSKYGPLPVTDEPSQFVLVTSAMANVDESCGSDMVDPLPSTMAKAKVIVAAQHGHSQSSAAAIAGKYSCLQHGQARTCIVVISARDCGTALVCGANSHCWIARCQECARQRDCVERIACSSQYSDS